jgi:hypothetical protein
MAEWQGGIAQGSHDNHDTAIEFILEFGTHKRLIKHFCGRSRETRFLGDALLIHRNANYGITML